MLTPRLLHSPRPPLAALLLIPAAASAHAGPGGPTPTTAAAGS